MQDAVGIYMNPLGSLHVEEIVLTCSLFLSGSIVVHLNF